MSYSHTHLRLFDKLVVLVALGIAAALFLSIGWLAIAPEDPLGAVSLLTHRQAGFMVLKAAALAAVTAVIATVMIGTKLADIGVFAAALGLSLVSLRGDTAEYLLINVARGDRDAVQLMAAKLAGESVIWFAVLVIAMVVSGLVMRWCFGVDEPSMGAASGDSPSSAGAPVRRTALGDMSICEIPWLSSWFGFAGAGGPQDGRWAGSKAALVTTGVAMFVFSVLVSGSSPRSIQHGQTCFAAFAAFYAGVWTAKRWFACRTAFWRLIPVPVVCVMGYLWTMVQGQSSGPYAHLASIPNSVFLRALPVTMISVGTLGALVAHWTVAEPRPKPRTQSARPAKRSARR